MCIYIVRLSVCPTVRLCVCLSVCLSVCASAALSVGPSVWLSVSLCVHPSARLFVRLFICVSVWSVCLLTCRLFLLPGMEKSALKAGRSTKSNITCVVIDWYAAHVREQDELQNLKEKRRAPHVTRARNESFSLHKI